MPAKRFLLIVSLALTACATTPQRSNDAIVLKLADELEANFLFPEFGQEYATYLRTSDRLPAYSNIDPRAYASSLTAHLQSVHPDGHLRVHYEPEAAEAPAGPTGSTPSRRDAIDVATRLLPDVAYLRMNLFPGDAASVEAVQNFVEAHSGSRNLIIDLRGHRGGGLAEMDLLFSHLFPVRTDLVQMDVRESVDAAGQSPIKDTKTTIRIRGPKGVVRRQHVAIPDEPPAFADTRVFVLTSNYTVSAAEHLAFALQKASRATIIGQATYGGAHFGGDIELGHDFYAFVPVGRTFDPATGQSWEGSGVQPDVDTEAGEALIEALVQIGVPRDEAIAIDANLNFEVPTRRRLGDQ